MFGEEEKVLCRSDRWPVNITGKTTTFSEYLQVIKGDSDS